MFYKIFGVIWVVLGLIWMIRPDHLRNRLQKKMTRRVKWIVFVFLLVFCFMMIGSVLKAPGIGIKIAGIIGIVITIKAILFITSKASHKIIDWWRAKPPLFFRIWGLGVFLTGLIFILFDM
jgi:multisubunit Na+/H+ antiporter MnhB subunit